MDNISSIDEFITNIDAEESLLNREISIGLEEMNLLYGYLDTLENYEMDEKGIVTIYNNVSTIVGEESIESLSDLGISGSESLADVIAAPFKVITNLVTAIIRFVFKVISSIIKFFLRIIFKIIDFIFGSKLERMLDKEYERGKEDGEKKANEAVSSSSGGGGSSGSSKSSKSKTKKTVEKVKTNLPDNLKNNIINIVGDTLIDISDTNKSKEEVLEKLLSKIDSDVLGNKIKNSTNVNNRDLILQGYRDILEKFSNKASDLLKCLVTTDTYEKPNQFFKKSEYSIISGFVDRYKRFSNDGLEAIKLYIDEIMLGGNTSLKKGKYESVTLLGSFKDFINEYNSELFNSTSIDTTGLPGSYNTVHMTNMDASNKEIEYISTTKDYNRYVLLRLYQTFTRYPDLLSRTAVMNGIAVTTTESLKINVPNWTSSKIKNINIENSITIAKSFLNYSEAELDNVFSGPIVGYTFPKGAVTCMRYKLLIDANAYKRDLKIFENAFTTSNMDKNYESYLKELYNNSSSTLPTLGYITKGMYNFGLDNSDNDLSIDKKTKLWHGKNNTIFKKEVFNINDTKNVIIKALTELESEIKEMENVSLKKDNGNRLKESAKYGIVITSKAIKHNITAIQASLNIYSSTIKTILNDIKNVEYELGRLIGFSSVIINKGYTNIGDDDE